MGVGIFAKDYFGATQPNKQQKKSRPPLPAAAQIRPAETDSFQIRQGL
jgi:hypothetical protein